VEVERLSKHDGNRQFHPAPEHEVASGRTCRPVKKRLTAVMGRSGAGLVMPARMFAKSLDSPHCRSRCGAVHTLALEQAAPGLARQLLVSVAPLVRCRSGRLLIAYWNNLARGEGSAATAGRTVVFNLDGRVLAFHPDCVINYRFGVGRRTSLYVRARPRLRFAEFQSDPRFRGWLRKAW